MEILVIGSGIAGLSAAIRSAEAGCHVILASPFASERAQSVMAAGGINAALDTMGEGDSTELHFEETIRGGAYLEPGSAVRGLCGNAPGIVRWLDSIGVMFSRTSEGEISQRSFGGQSKRRTAYAGASTGKQIVSALTQKCREYEITGRVERRTGLHFHSALISKGVCYGAAFTDAVTDDAVIIYADAVIMACGGMNKIFGKTTGSELCDGYAAGRLFSQGVELRNLEFIQYHPTSIETSNKRMLITEAVRGEGGRLYYEDGGRRVYFMEDKYGERGNLMPRDIVSREIYACPSQVFLDITFKGEKLIHERLEEVYELCMKYLDLDVTRESIPVGPTVHFFMGGVRVDDRHRTNIERLYAAGEFASKYHGANRLGGNSLLAAVYSGKVAAEDCSSLGELNRGTAETADSEALKEQMESVIKDASASSGVSAAGILSELAVIMNRDLGIVREADGLRRGISSIDSLIWQANSLGPEPGVPPYETRRIKYMLMLSKAVLMSALAREESRGAHYRKDFPESNEDLRRCSVAVMKDGVISIGYE